jgi:hypothetical protein
MSTGSAAARRAPEAAPVDEDNEEKEKGEADRDAKAKAAAAALLTPALRLPQ